MDVTVADVPEIHPPYNSMDVDEIKEQELERSVQMLAGTDGPVAMDTPEFVEHADPYVTSQIKEENPLLQETDSYMRMNDAESEVNADTMPLQAENEDAMAPNEDKLLQTENSGLHEDKNAIQHQQLDVSDVEITGWENRPNQDEEGNVACAQSESADDIEVVENQEPEQVPKEEYEEASRQSAQEQIQLSGEEYEKDIAHGQQGQENSVKEEYEETYEDDEKEAVEDTGNKYTSSDIAEKTQDKPLDPELEHDDERPPGVWLTFNGQDFVLFSESENPTYFTVPESQNNDNAASPISISAPSLSIEQDVFWSPMELLFHALRTNSMFNDVFEEDSELVIEFAELKLTVREDDVYTREISLEDMFRLHLGMGFVSTLHVVVSEAPRFIARYNFLASKISSLGDGAEEADEQNATSAHAEVEGVDRTSSETNAHAFPKDLPEEETQEDAEQTFVTVQDGSRIEDYTDASSTTEEQAFNHTYEVKAPNQEILNVSSDNAKVFQVPDTQESEAQSGIPSDDTGGRNIGDATITATVATKADVLVAQSFEERNQEDTVQDDQHNANLDHERGFEHEHEHEHEYKHEHEPEEDQVYEERHYYEHEREHGDDNEEAHYAHGNGQEQERDHKHDYEQAYELSIGREGEHEDEHEDEHEAEHEAEHTYEYGDEQIYEQEHDHEEIEQDHDHEQNDQMFEQYNEHIDEPSQVDVGEAQRSAHVETDNTEDSHKVLGYEVENETSTRSATNEGVDLNDTNEINQPGTNNEQENGVNSPSVLNDEDIVEYEEEQESARNIDDKATTNDNAKAGLEEIDDGLPTTGPLPASLDQGQPNGKRLLDDTETEEVLVNFDASDPKRARITEEA